MSRCWVAVLVFSVQFCFAQSPMYLDQIVKDRISPALDTTTHFFTDFQPYFVPFSKGAIDSKEKSIAPIIGAGYVSDGNSIATFDAGIYADFHSERGWYGGFSAHTRWASEQTEPLLKKMGYSFLDNSQLSILPQFYIGHIGKKIPVGVELGMGKHFLGDGYHSLLLSDNSFSYPYFKVNAKVWNIQYMSLNTLFFDVNNVGMESIYIKNSKLSTIHYLSWNVAHWFRLSFFESVVFQTKEEGFSRGLDLNYINPVIFMRPIEYSLGSADNSLMGTNIRFRIKKRHQLYSQVLIDEFLFKELRYNRGWWANKYGIQLGAKSHFFMNNSRLTFQLEYNFVRPYTYSFFYRESKNASLQNFGHAHEPLAHELGANFQQMLGRVVWSKNLWNVSANISIQEIGYDVSDTINFGQDIYKPYNSREKEYGNFVGQGEFTRFLSTQVRASYKLDFFKSLPLFFLVDYRNNYQGVSKPSSSYVFVGIRSGLLNN